VKIVQYIIADSKTSVERLENSIEYRVYSEEKKENKRFVSWLLTNRRTGVSPVYANVGGSIHRTRFGSDKSDKRQKKKRKRK